jgi:hypothetical protein
MAFTTPLRAAGQGSPIKLTPLGTTPVVPSSNGDAPTNYAFLFVLWAVIYYVFKDD